MITLDQIRLRLLDAIKCSKMTNSELARKLGISHQAVAQYFNQNKMPALDTFANICAILDLDANEILCLDNNIL